MRLIFRVFFPVIIGSLIFCGCIGPVKVRNTQQKTIIELDGKVGHTQTLAVLLAQAPPTALGQKAGVSFTQSLQAAIQRKQREFIVTTEHSEAFPDALHVFGHNDAPLDVFSIADVIRRKGYQGFLVARIVDIGVKTEETGYFLWRKPRHYMTVAASVELYDPFTASKMVSRIKEETFGVSSSDYYNLFDHDIQSIGKLDKVIAAMAAAAGKLAVESMASKPWMTTVLSVDPEGVVLAGGGRSGFREGDRLDVYQARRVMQGADGQKFIAPGIKLGMVRIAAVEGRFMRAMSEDPADIRVGDLAVAVKR